MRSIILLIVAGASWCAGAYLICLVLGPEMLISGRPELILLAFLAPPGWLVIGLLAWIALADMAWRDEHDDLIAPVEHGLATPPAYPAAFRANTCQP